MERSLYYVRLFAGTEDRFDQLHREIPGAVARGMTDAGLSNPEIRALIDNGGVQLDAETADALSRFARRRRWLLLLRAIAAGIVFFVATMILVAGCDYLWLLSDGARWLLGLCGYAITLAAMTLRTSPCVSGSKRKRWDGARGWRLSFRRPRAWRPPTMPDCCTATLNPTISSLASTVWYAS